MTALKARRSQVWWGQISSGVVRQPVSASHRDTGSGSGPSGEGVARLPVRNGPSPQMAHSSVVRCW
jgi:hypothetical protein